MGISIDPTLPNRDWSGSVKPTAETVGHLLSLSFGDAAKSAFDSIKTFRAQEEEVGQKAWTLWRESLSFTLEAFFKTASLTREPGDEELKRLLVEILEGSERRCAEKKGCSSWRRTRSSNIRSVFELYARTFGRSCRAWARAGGAGASSGG